MGKKYEFYPIDDVDETGITQRHSVYLEEYLQLKELRQYLFEAEIDFLEKECSQYEYALSVLLPESRAWTWAEWQNKESVAEKLQKKYDNFFDKKTTTSGFMYGKHRPYYEVVLNVLAGYFVDGDDTVMLFMSFSQEKELVLFIARLLYLAGYESYLVEIFMKASERIIAYERKEDEDELSMLLSGMDFTNSCLYHYVSFLRDSGNIDQEVKRLLYTVSVVG